MDRRSGNARTHGAICGNHMRQTLPIDNLRSRLHMVESYPPGVRAIPQPIRGVAFFPGGSGLWTAESQAEPPPLPVGGVMVLGHDFDSEASYYRTLARREGEVNGPTWRNLLSLFRRAGLSPERCFFT